MAAVGTLTIEMAANVARLQRDMERATKTVGGAMDRIQRSVQTATRALGALTAAFAAYKTVQGILQQADAMTQLNSRLQLVTRSQEEFLKTQTALVSISQRSYTSLGATVDLYTALARSTRELGVSQNELLRVVETFNKSIIISGGSVQAAEAAITQFNQAMASGVLRGEEFNSISEQAPMIMELLASALGVTRGALRDMAKEGLLVAELVLPALIEGSKGVDQQFAQMNKTVGQAGQQMKNSFMLFLDELNRGQDITSTFAGAIDGITAGLDYLTKLLKASQGDLSDYIDTTNESVKLARQQEEAMRAQNEQVAQSAKELLKQKEAAELAKKAADELQKSYEKLLDSLRGDLRGSTAALQAEQQGLNKAQEEFLELVSGPEWQQYSAAQKMIIADLFKQRIETEQLIDLEKERAKAAEDRLKKMLADEKEFREELKREDDKRAEEKLKKEQEFYDEQKRQIEKIGDQLTDALMRAFESGKGFGQAFKDTLVNMFRTMVLRPVLAPIVGGLSAALGGGSAMAAGGALAGGGAGMGFLGGLSAASSALGTGIAAGFSNALSLNFAGSLTAAGQLIGTGAMSGITAGIGLAAGTLLPIVGAIAAIPSIGRALFGGGRRTTATGIAGTFSAAGADVMQFQDWRRSGGLLSSGSRGTSYSPIAQETDQFLDMALMSIAESTRAYLNILNLNASGIDRVNQQIRISLTGLSPEKQQEALNKALQDFADLLAEGSRVISFSGKRIDGTFKITFKGIEDFRRVGETSSQTLERLATGLVTVNQVFDTLNLTLYKSSLTAGGMASELIDLFGGVEAFVDATTAYYQEFYSEAERVDILTRQLTTSFGQLGLELPATREAFRSLVEAQDLTTESGRQMFAALMNLSPAFASISPSLDLIVEAVDDLGESVLISEEILRERISLEDRLLRLQGDTDALRDRERNSLDESNRALLDRIFALEDEIQATEDATRAAQQYADELQSQFQEAQNVTNLALEAVRRSIQSEIQRYQQAAGATDSAFARLQRSVEASARQAEESIRRTYNALNDALNLQMQSAATARSVAQENVSALQSVFDLLKSNIEDLMTDILPQMTVVQGRVFLARALATAQSTGYLPDREQLSSAISAVRSGLTPEAFGSSFEMRREQLRLVVQLQSLQNLTGNQLSTAELQLKAADEQVLLLERRIEDARLQFELDLQQNRDYYDSILQSAQDQIDATRGVDNGIVSVNEAINLLQTAIQAEEYATAQIEILEQQLNTAEQQVNALRGIDNSIISLGSAITSLSSAVRAEAAASTAAALAVERARIASAVKTREFAAGGLHSGGMRLVGERGPELEVTGPARYMSNATLASMMNNGSSEDIKQMREENKVQMRAMVSLQNRMTKIIEQWNGDGLPTERVEA